MIINAFFLKSLYAYDENEDFAQTQIAFLGRSNVGKSSLINALCQKKQLAKSSNTPGKTQLINFFKVQILHKEQKYELIFVDLPGFGYAKVSKHIKKAWQKNLTEFLQKQRAIKLFIHLRDSRHSDLELDYNFKVYVQNFLQADQKMLEVFTKFDKLNQAQRIKLKRKFTSAFFVSSLTKQGLADLESAIIEQSLGL